MSFDPGLSRQLSRRRFPRLEDEASLISTPANARFMASASMHHPSRLRVTGEVSPGPQPPAKFWPAAAAWQLCPASELQTAYLFLPKAAGRRGARLQLLFPAWLTQPLFALALHKHFSYLGTCGLELGSSADYGLHRLLVKKNSACEYRIGYPITSSERQEGNHNTQDQHGDRQQIEVVRQPRSCSGLLVLEKGRHEFLRPRRFRGGCCSRRRVLLRIEWLDLRLFDLFFDSLFDWLFDWFFDRLFYLWFGW